MMRPPSTSQQLLHCPLASPGPAHLAIVSDEHKAGLWEEGGILPEPAQLLGRQLLVQCCRQGREVQEGR